MAKFFNRREVEVSPQEQFDQAQKSILDVIAAFIGIGCSRNFTERTIISAAGNAHSPDAVSKAIRQNISPKILERQWTRKR